MSRPIPHPTPETREFWDGVARDALMFQVCGDCAQVQSYPRVYCTRCHSRALSWRESTGRATLYSYTTVYRAATPAFRDDVPYVIALVDVEEGFRLMVNVRREQAARLRIGSAVRVRSADRGDGVLLQYAEME